MVVLLGMYRLPADSALQLFDDDGCCNDNKAQRLKGRFFRKQQQHLSLGQFYEPNLMAKHSMANVQMFVWTSLRTRAFSSPEASIPSIRNIAVGAFLVIHVGSRDGEQEIE